MLKIAAAEDDLNFSQVVELALKEYLERRKKVKKVISVVTVIQTTLSSSVTCCAVLCSQKVILLHFKSLIMQRSR